MRHRPALPLIWLSLALASVRPIGAQQEALRGNYDLTRPSVPQPGEVFTDVGFDQKLGQRVPLDAPVQDESGRTVPLGTFFGKRPVIFALIYYRCPMLCGQTLNSLTRSMRALTATAGDTYELVTVSFDPKDNPERAARKKQALLETYGRARADRGIHFLTAAPEVVDRLKEAVGFRTRYNPATDEYAHPAGILILAPDGTITRYFFGIDYPPKELQAALDQASAGRVGSPVARLLMLCYDYDPQSGRYTLAVVRLLQLLGSATALLLFGYVGFQLIRDRRRQAAPPAT
ncbi:MAG: electron transporter SenC [Isosphaeraceae bacterium]|jgi:protein SCO1/2|nr:MAG: electron transporter SenC [Isosphaeraceae bacterium]